MLVELAPISDPELVAAAIADALGVGERPGQEPREALAAYLRDRQALLVLDNFEQRARRGAACSPSCSRTRPA